MFIKLCNLGRDTEVRFTQSGKPVATLACAYSIGYGDNKKAQWIEAALWGDKAEKLAQYLTKGTKILLTADDVELEQYQKNDGSTGAKLRCRVIDIEFAGSKQDSQQQQQPAQQQKPQQNAYAQQKGQARPQPQQQQQGGYGANTDDGWSDSDIPF